MDLHFEINLGHEISICLLLSSLFLNTFEKLLLGTNQILDLLLYKYRNELTLKSMVIPYGCHILIIIT
jgi:hypothetical protein